MKKNNPPKKLKLIKKTIAHLNNEQMISARGGDTMTVIFCTDPNSVKSTDHCNTKVCESTKDCH